MTSLTARQRVASRPRARARTPPARHGRATPHESARAAGLRYVNDDMPGITRKRAGKGWAYYAPDGRRVTDDAERARIQKLAIPPAWTDVWICPYANGHLQATGRDARGRKQYRYHPEWRRVRDETKYHRTLAFADALPDIRRRVHEDLKLPGLPREKVLATVVLLLERTLIRVGNEEYAQQNGSYGLTTLRDHHVKFRGGRVDFSFTAKGGKRREVELFDKRLARIVKQCRDIPGDELFQYLDDDGERQIVDSADVNAYLKEITGKPFTAKDFRTWAGTVYAALALQEIAAFDSKAHAKRNVTQAIERVAERLGNTPTICRKCYVHPAVIETYLDGELVDSLRAQVEREIRKGGDAHALSPEESAVVALLRRRLANETGLADKLEASVRQARRTRKAAAAKRKGARRG